MSKFLKTNPIALRHCLLYHFLQSESVNVSYSDFRRMFGVGVIGKEEFYLYIDHFEQGIFDNSNVPVADVTDILRSDKYALRVCIFYESLTHRLSNIKHHLPSFDAYKNFCKVIGEDVMEYREFDFWYYRFVKKEYDLNFERREDKKIHELSDMPIDILKSILSYLDIFERTKLSGVSQSFRTFIQNQKLFIDSLEFHIYKHSANIGFGIGRRHIYYGEKHYGCYRQIGTKEQPIQDASHWEQALNDFGSILRSSKHQLHVKNLIIDSDYPMSLLKVLPYFKPGYLTTINAHIKVLGFQESNEYAMRKVVELDQWKQAKRLSMHKSYFFGPLHHLYHFKQFDVLYNKLSLRDIRQIPEILLKSPDFESCIIEAENSFNIGDVRLRHPSPNPSEYFEINFKESRFEITRKKI